MLSGLNDLTDGEFLMTSALVMLLALATGADASSAELKADVNRGVRRLDDPALSVRTEAETKLVELGPKIIDLLPQFDSPRRRRPRRSAARPSPEFATSSSGDAEAHAWIRRCRPHVTLKAVDRPLSEILADIAGQTGNKFADFRPQMGQQAGNPRVSVDFTGAPFWTAVDQTLEKAHLTIYPYAGKDEMGYMARETGGLASANRISTAGPLRFAANQLTATKNLAGGAAGSLRLDMQVAWEPRLRPIVLQIPLAKLKAIDDRGVPIAAENPEQQLEQSLSTPGGSAVEFQIPLVLPPRSAGAIGSIKGTLRALLPGKIETFEFANLKDAVNVEQHRAGVVVTVESMRQNGDGWELRMRARFENAGSALETFRNWVYNNEAYLIDAKGKVIPNGGYQPTLLNKDEVGLAYEFDLPSGPAGLKFIYKTPAVLSSVPLPFEFKNLPLP